MKIRSLLVAAVLLLASRPLLASPASVQCFTPQISPSQPGGSANVLCVSLVPLAVVPPTDEGFELGCLHTYVIKAGDGTQGNWGFLDPGRCSEGPCAGLPGPAALECGLEDGWPGSFADIDEVMRTLPGARHGALRDAMQSRFDRDTDRRSICYERYSGNGERVIVVPMTTALDRGRNEVTVVGYAAFFLKALPPDGGDAVEAEFINLVARGR